MNRERGYPALRDARRGVEMRPHGRLFSVSVPAPEISPAQFLRHARGQERFLWQPPDMGNGERCGFAGFGAAVELVAWGAERVTHIAAQAEALFATAVLPAPDILSRPRLFGGFSFRDDFVPDNTWSVFYPAQFVLPHFQLSWQGEDVFLTLNGMLPLEDDPAEWLPALTEALQARRALISSELTADWQNQPEKPPAINYPMSLAQWTTLIQRATAEMRAGGLQKAVLSRVCEIRYEQRVAVDAALAYLDQAYPDCYRFLFEPRPFHAFYGATPELLVGVHGRHLTTMGLAGSAPRSADPAVDARFAADLLASRKNRFEHQLVVDALDRRLAPFAAEICHPAQPEIMRLGYIHHLHTPVTAVLHDARGVLPLVAQLHPTPALGGVPRDAAMAFIQSAEPVPRGWYAAPVGWIDPQMDGEFLVAIRSAVTQERRVWLYAGGGIVADSQPEQEWAETAVKFHPMLRALGLSTAELTW
jgi:menaquinone-specific isochorismate synthase